MRVTSHYFKGQRNNFIWLQKGCQLEHKFARRHISQSAHGIDTQRHTLLIISLQEFNHAMKHVWDPFRNGILALIQKCHFLDDTERLFRYYYILGVRFEDYGNDFQAAILFCYCYLTVSPLQYVPKYNEAGLTYERASGEVSQVA